MQEFTFYWKDGKRQVFKGTDAADALNKAGFGNGAVRALDVWARGNDDTYRWDTDLKKWIRTKPFGMVPVVPGTA